MYLTNILYHIGGIDLNARLIFGALITAFIFSGCTNTKTVSNDKTEISSSVPTTKEVPVNKINDLNKIAEIKNGKTTAYTLEITEVVDVTEKAMQEIVNNDSWLDYYSNHQAVQAVRISIKISNKTSDVLSMPYLDDISVIDSAGVTNVGGWKDESGSPTEFGSYVYNEDMEPDEKLYLVKPNETRIATSTVLLATKSASLTFEFISTMFKDSINFEMKIN